MNTDSYFEIGSTHEVCQDYALSGKINDSISFAIVTDGCSMSHKMCGQADVGARIVAHAARATLQRIYGNDEKISITDNDVDEFAEIKNIISKSVVDAIKTVGVQLKMSNLYADCTLLIAITDGKVTNFFLFGDGGAAITFNDGSAIFKYVTYLSGAPYYLSYHLRAEGTDLYKNEFGGCPIIFDTYTFENNFELKDSKGIQCFVDSKEYSDSIGFTIEDAETVSVFSDGVSSFRQEPNGTLTVDIIKEFVGFKNRKGEFVQRRMKRMLKDHKNDGIHHYDDISMASINLS
tara:strand:- start:102 stop:974 length:873 start_codon:yes stop_codon:yes gene_type:complete